MKLTTLLMIAVASSAGLAHAVDHYQSERLPFEKLPQVCQTHFKRAESCYAKANAQAADFYRTNTEMLRGAMPAATPEQREQMCAYADRQFAAKAHALKCE